MCNQHPARAHPHATEVPNAPNRQSSEIGIDQGICSKPIRVPKASAADNPRILKIPQLPDSMFPDTIDLA